MDEETQNMINKLKLVIQSSLTTLDLIKDSMEQSAIAIERLENIIKINTQK